MLSKVRLIKNTTIQSIFVSLTFDNILYIVVLLILAGVSINLVLGNNGIIAKAKEAETKSAEASRNDLAGMDELTEEIDSAVEGAVNVNDLSIGDYVDYEYDGATSYTLKGEVSGTESDQIIGQKKGLKWQILYIDEKNGNIDLISDETTNEKVAFKGALGFNNGVYALNDICKKLYSNKNLGAKARSINLKDTEKFLTSYTYRNNISYKVEGPYTGEYSYYPKILEKSKGIEIDTGNTPQITKDDSLDLCDESNPIYDEPTKETVGQATNNGIIIINSEYNLPLIDQIYDKRVINIFKNDNEYWLATRFLMGGNYSPMGLRMVSHGNICGMNYGDIYYSNNNTTFKREAYLRPIVTINIKKIKNSKDASNTWILKK